MNERAARDTDVASNLAAVRERIAAAAREAGRDPASVTLVVVTKTVTEARIVDALAVGATDLGENRAQELVAKAVSLGGQVPRWHFIGRLQRNKINMLGPHVSLWHSIDRVELAAPLARAAPAAAVLVEVNLSDEPQKGGCRPADAAALTAALTDAGLAVEGLMTVPAAGPDPRPAFSALRDLAGRLGLARLSMGMTGDFEAAVAEGATIVRIGSAIFGPRPGPRPGADGLRR